MCSMGSSIIGVAVMFDDVLNSEDIFLLKC